MSYRRARSAHEFREEAESASRFAPSSRVIETTHSKGIQEGEEAWWLDSLTPDTRARMTQKRAAEDGS